MSSLLEFEPFASSGCGEGEDGGDFARAASASNFKISAANTDPKLREVPSPPPFGSPPPEPPPADVSTATTSALASKFPLLFPGCNRSIVPFLCLDPASFPIRRSVRSPRISFRILGLEILFEKLGIAPILFEFLVGESISSPL